jgi:hypothetical protein
METVHFKPTSWEVYTLDPVTNPEELVTTITKLLRTPSLPDELGYQDKPRKYFRGHSDSEWMLTPSLLRPIMDELKNLDNQSKQLVINFGTKFQQFQEWEKNLTVRFAQIAPRHLSEHLARVCYPFDVIDFQTPIERIFQTWSLMRHYGAPTRFLDWTASPFVALYFTCNDSSYWDRDGAIWCVDDWSFSDRYKKVYNIEYDEDKATIERVYPIGVEPCTWIVPAQIADDRMLTQQGYFSVSNLIHLNHDEGLAESDSSKLEVYDRFRIIIPAKQKPELLNLLRYFNITPQSLFPGLDGECRHLMETHARWAWNTLEKAKNAFHEEGTNKKIL